MKNDYQIMHDRLTNGDYFPVEAAKERINELRDELRLTPEQADELTRIAEENGGGLTVPERLDNLEKHQFEDEMALMELAELIESLLPDILPEPTLPPEGDAPVEEHLPEQPLPDGTVPEVTPNPENTPAPETTVPGAPIPKVPAESGAVAEENAAPVV